MRQNSNTLVIFSWNQKVSKFVNLALKYSHKGLRKIYKLAPIESDQIILHHKTNQEFVMASNESRIVGFGDQIDASNNQQPINEMVGSPPGNVELEDELENLIISFSRLQISETFEAEIEE